MKICGRDQNIDQTIHIKKRLCVSCFSKQQVHEDFQLKLDNYIRFLKERNELTTEKENEIELWTLLNDILVPNNILLLSPSEIPMILKELEIKIVQTAPGKFGNTI